MIDVFCVEGKLYSVISVAYLLRSSFFCGTRWFGRLLAAVIVDIGFIFNVQRGPGDRICARSPMASGHRTETSGRRLVPHICKLPLEA